MRFKLYDTIRLARSLPDNEGLSVGSQGAILQNYEGESQPAYLVEFCADDGETLAIVTVSEDMIEAVDK